MLETVSTGWRVAGMEGSGEQVYGESTNDNGGGAMGSADKGKGLT